MLGSLRIAIICSCLLAVSLCLAASAFALSEEEREILRMIYRDEELVTPTRSPKPISQVAENITVVTAEEIEAINAHTLSDVLYHVTGVQIDSRGGPGSLANVFIQGSNPRHVQVMVDGVSLNNLSDNVPDIGAFPVQQIERVEIVKGPASAAWGSSLGGVINIITKSPDPDSRLSGSVSADGGERGTGDFRADLSGTAGKVGYYLYGGGLTSDGLTSHTATDLGGLYTKLQWKATERANAQFSLSYTKGARGDGSAPAAGLAFGDNVEYFFSTLSLTYTLSDNLSLDLSGRVSTKRSSIFASRLGSGADVERKIGKDLIAGGSAKVTWQSEMNNLVVGFDYDDGTLDATFIKDGRQELTKWAVFANDTVSLGDFAVTPGLRYDHTSINGDFVSPSIGLTYTPLERTSLRAYVARGFNTPPLFSTFGDGVFFVANPGLKMEEVWSYSLGVETTFLKHFWFKSTGFLHHISDVITTTKLPNNTFTAVNSGKQRRQGVEAEVRTLPVYNTSLMAGFAFVDARDRETGREIPDVPRYTWDVGIDYNDNTSFRGALRGHYIWWNAEAANNARYKAFIWDVNLAKSIFDREGAALEIFFTAHNIFNGSQYFVGIFPNPRRWFEGGVRYKF